MTDVYAVNTLSSISSLSGALNLCHVTLRDYEKARGMLRFNNFLFLSSLGQSMEIKLYTKPKWP